MAFQASGDINFPNYRWGGSREEVKRLLWANAETLEKEAAGYYHLITSSELEENLRATLQDVFVSWLEQRFSDKSKQEIEMLLLGALPDLRETRSGKDLVHIGWLEGKEEGREEGKEEGIDEGERLGKVKSLLMLLDAKFGSVAPEIRERVLGLASSEVDKRLLQLVTAESIDQMRW